MKSLLYTAGLLAVLIASVVVLRSIDGGGEPIRGEPSTIPAVESSAPPESSVDIEEYDDSEALELYAAGSRLFDLWHEREATTLLERAVGADSSLFDAWVRLVECYSHPLVGREDDALSALGRARELGGANGDSDYLDGLEQLFVVRDFLAAAAMLGRATEADAPRTDAEFYHAQALFSSGQLKEAQRACRAAARGSDRVGRLAELEIRCAVAAGDYGAAADESRDLARIFAQEPYPYVILALVEQVSGRTVSAVEFSNNALVLDSNYVPAIMARANLYAAAGEFAAARVSFEKLLMFDDPLLRAMGFEGIGFVDLLAGRFVDAADVLDRAIQSAMLAGAVRRGLTVAAQLVGYLCELGRAGAATAAVERWVSGFGEIPVALAGLRINILNGDLEAAGVALEGIRSSKEWSEWAGMMSIDSVEMAALVHIGAGQVEAALGILSDRSPAVGGRWGSRVFLRGYASFDSGKAEEAAQSFATVGRLLYGIEFPYHGDAVQFVRSLFYLGETSIARGNESDAAAYYERFLGYWGDSDWELQAVDRARERLESTSPSPSP